MDPNQNQQPDPGMPQGQPEPSQPTPTPTPLTPEPIAPVLTPDAPDAGEQQPAPVVPGTEGEEPGGAQTPPSEGESGTF